MTRGASEPGRAREEVRRYFNEQSNVFLGLYEGQTSRVQRLATAIFRSGVQERFVLSLRLLGAVDGRRILDVGCGAGPLAIALAERGARVTGVDLASTMIARAEALASELPPARRPRFVVGDFLAGPPPGPEHEAVVALGVTDYLPDPLPLLERMVAATSDRLLASFPAAWRPQNPIRRTWLATKRCPVYFYTHRRVRDLGARLGIRRTEVLPFTCGYMLYGVK